MKIKGVEIILHGKKFYEGLFKGIRHSRATG